MAGPAINNLRVSSPQVAAQLLLAISAAGKALLLGAPKADSDVSPEEHRAIMHAIGEALVYGAHDLRMKLLELYPQFQVETAEEELPAFRNAGANEPLLWSFLNG